MELLTRELVVRRGGRTLLDGFRAEFNGGEAWAVLGPNGSGKSSLLLTLAGQLSPAAGEVILDGRASQSWSYRQRAERIAWQGSLPSSEFGFTVAERLHLARGDSRKPEEAQAHLDLEELSDRRLYQLSAGERQRVELAALWLRDAPIWLLDEPTAHLDLRHQVRWLSMLRQEAALGRTVIIVLHDLTQAHAVAEQALLLHGDGRSSCGRNLLEPEVLRDLYGTRIQRLTGEKRTELVPEY